MDYKNDNRTPRDRITGEFLSELLFSDPEGECRCIPGIGNSKLTSNTVSADSVGIGTNRFRCTETKRRHNTNCGNSRICTGSKVEFAGDYSLAMAYVPMQEFREIYDMEIGFSEGTIFKELVFPFYPTPCRKGANCCDK